MALRPLDPLWRTGSTDDREICRQYLAWPATDIALERLTLAMNDVAIVSEPAVGQVQAWIDEIQSLEADYADRVSSNTAHLGNVASYSGPAPGTTITKDDRRKRLDVIEWDTSLLRVDYKTGNGPASSSNAVLEQRIGDLKGRIFRALGLEPSQAGNSYGMFMIERS